MAKIKHNQAIAIFQRVLAFISSILQMVKKPEPSPDTPTSPNTPTSPTTPTSNKVL